MKYLILLILSTSCATTFVSETEFISRRCFSDFPDGIKRMSDATEDEKIGVYYRAAAGHMFCHLSGNYRPWLMKWKKLTAEDHNKHGYARCPDGKYLWRADITCIDNDERPPAYGPIWAR